MPGEGQSIQVKAVEGDEEGSFKTIYPSNNSLPSSGNPQSLTQPLLVEVFGNVLGAPGNDCFVSVDFGGWYVNVLGPATPPPPPGLPTGDAVFQVSNINVSNLNPAISESVEITAQITNVGAGEGQQDIVLKINGGAVGNGVPLSLQPNRFEGVVFRGGFDEPGEYTLEVCSDDECASIMIDVEDCNCEACAIPNSIRSTSPQFEGQKAQSTTQTSNIISRPMAGEECDPVIVGINFPSVIALRTETNWTLDYFLPVLSSNISVVIKDVDTNESNRVLFDTGDERRGTISFIETCERQGIVELEISLATVVGISAPATVRYTCGVIGVSNPPEPKKPFLTGNRIVAGMNVAAGSLAAIAGKLAVTPSAGQTQVLAGNIAIASGVLWAGSSIIAFIIDDPPDSNFRAIALPPSLNIARVQSAGVITLELANALNALIDHHDKMLGLSLALLHSIERAQGAAAANDDEWQSKQMNAAANYATQWSQLLRNQRNVSLAFERALNNASVIETDVSPSDFLTFQNQVNQQGLPTEILSLFSQFDMGQEITLKIGEFISDQAPGEVSGDIFDHLLGESYMNSADAVADALDDFSDEVGTESGSPSPAPRSSIEAAVDANGNGVIDDLEIRTAIQWWILGQTVPGTNETISDTKIRELIQIWILGETVGTSVRNSSFPKHVSRKAFAI
jgi:hypothetical protein